MDRFGFKKFTKAIRVATRRTEKVRLSDPSRDTGN
jgi:hypothetical protein